MSYILDALRKSEHERHKAGGLNASLLYPLEMQRNSKPWLILALLLLAAAAVAAYVWWRPATSSVNSHAIATIAPASAVASSPKPQALPQPAHPSAIAQTPQQHDEIRSAERIPHQRLAATRVAPERFTSAPHPEPAPKPAAPVQAAIPAAVVSIPLPPNKPSGSDPLQGLPALNITGYLQNEQGASLAMINNKLVHEGEEISPGLRLVKILDGSAIFSYKGYVFSR